MEKSFLKNRISFFIDGFNVYHALEDQKSFHKYKWLDYSSLAKCFITSKDEVVDIYYFSAYTEWDQRKVERHRTFINALKIKGVKIILGKFKLRDKHCRVCFKNYKSHEEKQTDVNISIQLFQDAHNNTFDTAILVTGDSDIIPAVKAIKRTFPFKKIGLLIPIGRRAEELKEECDFHMKMKEKHLRDSQFPDKIIIDPENNLSLDRPLTWI